MEIKHVVMVAILVVCASVSYYFFIALPNQNETRIAIEKQKLDMEKEKIEREQLEKQTQESQRLHEKSQRELDLYQCRAAVVYRADQYLQLNGTPEPGKPGVYNAPRSVHEDVARKLKEGYDDCQRMYGDHRQ